MSKVHLVIPDIHCHPEHPNERADWLAQLILDVRPDVVINLGDQWDFSSLSSYDKGKRSFVGRSYRNDLSSGLEFSDRLWSRVRSAKKRLPRTIFLEGNHEHRIEKALDLSPEYTGTIGFKDLDLERNYDEIIRYSNSGPGYIEVDGIYYAHYFVSGISGRPIISQHHGHALISKLARSATVGHAHTCDYHIGTTVDGKRLHGLVAGCFFDYHSDWAGLANNFYWRGVIIKRNVEDGQYDPEFVSLDQLRKVYGND